MNRSATITRTVASDIAWGFTPCVGVSDECRPCVCKWVACGIPSDFGRCPWIPHIGCRGHVLCGEAL